MLFSGKRRALPPPETGSANPFRPLLLGLVFAVCGVGFWYNFAYRFEKIEARSLFLDEIGTVTPADCEALEQRRAHFFDTWGVRLLIHIRDREVLLPELSKNTLFVGVGPKRDQALVVLPPLMKKALQGENLSGLEVTLRQCMKQKPAYPCVDEVLGRLWEYVKEE